MLAGGLHLNLSRERWAGLGYHSIAWDCERLLCFHGCDPLSCRADSFSSCEVSGGKSRRGKIKGMGKSSKKRDYRFSGGGGEARQRQRGIVTDLSS